jgi:hypothetical protein
MNEPLPELPLRKHKAPHKELAKRYKDHFARHDYRVAAVGSFLLFVASLFASLLAGHFAKEVATNPVGDIVLSNTPALHVGGLFVYGTFLFVIFVAAIALAHPRRIPFTFLSLALFFFIRAGFVSLTHIAAFPERAVTDFGFTLKKYFFGNDLFFSGHTGAPFMMALVFWKDTKLRFAFLGWSVFFALVVLLGHLHYSIDVLSAYFITYAVYDLAEWLFPEYQSLFYSDFTNGNGRPNA